MQVLGEYSEDIKNLAGMIMKECDEYTKANVIKSIAKYNFEEFAEIYLEALRSKNATLRVAAAQAIGSFGDEKYERNLIIAANDRMWIVRNAAVKALGNINSARALEAVARATSDGEWWVRYNAAKTLITMRDGMASIDNILSKYDEYASDAIKYVLYRETPVVE